MSPFPTFTHIDLSDEECDAVRRFFQYGATAGPNRSTPAFLAKYMDPMAAVAGRITIEQDRARKARESEALFRKGDQP